MCIGKIYLLSLKIRPRVRARLRTSVVSFADNSRNDSEDERDSRYRDIIRFERSEKRKRVQQEGY